MRISDWSSDVCSSDLERHLQRFLVDEPLVEPAMLAEKEALIRGVDDDGIFRDAVLVEPVEQPADILVDRHDGAQVALDVALVLEVVQLLPRVEGEALAGIAIEQHKEKGRAAWRLNSSP